MKLFVVIFPSFLLGLVLANGPLPMATSSGENVLCPDKHSRCPQGTTCCPISDTQFGCCPMPNAVCCTDHLHCCPSGTSCDLQHQRCLEHQPNGTRNAHPIHRKFPASVEGEVEAKNVQQQSNDDDVPCQDGVHFCAEGQTCCRVDDSKMGLLSVQAHFMCCPTVHGVCCPDGVHCCREGEQCDPEGRGCIGSAGARRQSAGNNPFLRQTAPSSQRDQPGSATKLEADPTEPAVNLCGGNGATKQSSCPANSKCCRHRNPLDGSKSDGCCPFADGQCCAHSAHCCPQGFACDSVEGRCVSEQQHEVTLSTKMFATVKAAKMSSPSKPKICPDGTVCGPLATCCRQLAGDGTETYECCPHNKGNCCPGQLCCPNGYKCSGGGACHKMTVREQIAQLLFSED